MKRKLVTAAEAKAYVKQHKAPCSDCPWSRKSLPGWLGIESPQEWLRHAHGHCTVDCHTRRRSDDPERFWQCAGISIYRANVIQRVDPPGLVLPSNKVNVFATPQEFLAHHDRFAGTTTGRWYSDRPNNSTKPKREGK
jgi:hypothetical protein